MVLSRALDAATGSAVEVGIGALFVCVGSAVILLGSVSSDILLLSKRLSLSRSMLISKELQLMSSGFGNCKLGIASTKSDPVCSWSRGLLCVPASKLSRSVGATLGFGRDLFLGGLFKSFVVFGFDEDVVGVFVLLGVIRPLFAPLLFAGDTYV